MRRYILFLSFIFPILLASCGEQEESTPTLTAEPLSPTATAEPTTAPTPTTRPTNTPIPNPLLDVSDQTLTEAGALTIDRIVTPEEGWLALYRNPDEPPAADNLITSLPIAPGEEIDFEIEIDIMQAQPELAAVLHANPNAADSLDPEGDEVLASAVIELTIDADIPEIEIDDQAVGEDGLLLIKRVYVREEGWLAIYNESPDEETPPELIGFLPVEAGENESLGLTIRWHEATPMLTAVLHREAAAFGRFDPPHPAAESDPPVLNPISGEPVSAVFEVSLPPQIVIYNQPVIDSQFTIERVISEGDGWLVVYQSDGGQPGFIIGSQPIADGLSEQVAVEVDGSAVTEELLVTLHDDTGEIGEFDFPGNDQPRRYQDQLFFIPFSTATGSYLITSDQAMLENNVSVPVIVSSVSAWAVVHADEGGELGEILGQTAVPAGLSRHTAVTLEEEVEPGQRLHVVLYEDAGTAAEFEPDSADQPLRRFGTIVSAPFDLLEN